MHMSKERLLMSRRNELNLLDIVHKLLMLYADIRSHFVWGHWEFETYKNEPDGAACAPQPMCTSHSLHPTPVSLQRNSDLPLTVQQQSFCLTSGLYGQWNLISWTVSPNLGWPVLSALPLPFEVVYHDGVDIQGSQSFCAWPSLHWSTKVRSANFDNVRFSLSGGCELFRIRSAMAAVALSRWIPFTVRIFCRSAWKASPANGQLLECFFLLLTAMGAIWHDENLWAKHVGTEGHKTQRQTEATPIVQLRFPRRGSPIYA